VSVNAWNRTAARAKPLEEVGARVFEDPAEAARGARRLHLSLSDDAAVDDVLERARPGIASDTLIIDHTTTSPSGAVDRIRRWDERGVRLVHAPVFMGPQNALECTGLMLVSGERARVEAVTPELAAMTGKVVDLGARVDAAAAYKLFGNMFLMFLTTGLAEVFGLAKALEVDPREAASLFSHFNPGATLPARIDRMLGGAFDRPSWELAMARKDARLMVEAAREGGVALAVLPAIMSRMDELIARGHGKDDWTVLAKDALSDASGA
jgi:3-hydroxyisobutyrate dehydrogenase